jgi:ABC-type antimicrobial peptide transport system permease subunit
MFLLASLSVIALILAVIGIYGVIAYTVAQRRPELGIRMALGAQRSDILKLVVRQGVFLTLTGIAIGPSQLWRAPGSWAAFSTR